MERSLIAFDNIFPDIRVWANFLKDIVSSIDEQTEVCFERSSLGTLLRTSLIEAFPTANVILIDAGLSAPEECYIFRDHPLLSYKQFLPAMWEYKLGVFRELVAIRAQLGLPPETHYVESVVDYSRHRDHAMILALLEQNNIPLNLFMTAVVHIQTDPYGQLFIRGSSKTADIIYQSLVQVYGEKAGFVSIEDAEEWTSYKGGSERKGIIRVLDAVPFIAEDHVFQFNAVTPEECDVTFKSTVWLHKERLYRKAQEFVTDDVLLDTEEWYQ